MVLNSRSIAGGPQIFAPIARYARSSLGARTSGTSASLGGKEYEQVVSVCSSRSTKQLRRLAYTACPISGSCEVRLQQPIMYRPPFASEYRAIPRHNRWSTSVERWSRWIQARPSSTICERIASYGAKSNSCSE